MSEYHDGPDKICLYCAAYKQGADRGTREGTCGNTPRWMRILFGLRFVTWHQTCDKFKLHKRYGGRDHQR